MRKSHSLFSFFQKKSPKKIKKLGVLKLVPQSSLVANPPRKKKRKRKKERMILCNIHQWKYSVPLPSNHHQLAALWTNPYSVVVYPMLVYSLTFLFHLKTNLNPNLNKFQARFPQRNFHIHLKLKQYWSTPFLCHQEKTWHGQREVNLTVWLGALVFMFLYVIQFYYLGFLLNLSIR